MKTRITLTILAASLGLAATAQARYYVPKHGARCKTHYVKRIVKIRERKHGKLVRHHHKIVMVRQARCVYVKPKATKPSAPTVTLPAPQPASAPNVRAGIDPSYTQDAGDNLKVTWAYSASAPVPLPDGTLTLGVTEPGKAGNSGGCSMNVGGDTAGGNCTVELSRYGNWNVTVTYASSDSTVSPATSTDTEDIEPLPATITKTWGTDAPSNQPAVSATVIGSTADTTVTDANYEGAASVLVTDQNGDSCTATVTGTTASCQMALGPNVTPSSYQVGYPGGATTHSTQAVNPGGTQQVTTTWPARQVSVTNPSVTIQQATIEECGGSQSGGPFNEQFDCTAGHPENWLNPIQTNVNKQIELNAKTFGSLASDQDPSHGDGQVSGYLTWTVAGGAQGTDYTASNFQNGPDNSTDCSKMATQQWLGGDPSDSANYGPDEPFGTCYLVFQTPGTYFVTVSYTTEDANYASVSNVDRQEIDVLP